PSSWQPSSWPAFANHLPSRLTCFVSARGRIAAGPDQALNFVHEYRQVERLPQVPVHLEALGLGLHLRRLVRRHEDDLRLHGGLAEPLDQLDPALLREAVVDDDQIERSGTEDVLLGLLRRSRDRYPISRFLEDAGDGAN